MSGINSLINKFENLNNKTILHIKDMENMKSYPILKAAKTTTKYGESIQIDVQNYIIFLPARYNSLLDEDILELSSGKYCIRKEAGEDEKSYLLHLDHFDLNEYIITQNGSYPVWKWNVIITIRNKIRIYLKK